MTRIDPHRFPRERVSIFLNSRGEQKVLEKDFSPKRMSSSSGPITEARWAGSGQLLLWKREIWDSASRKMEVSQAVPTTDVHQRHDTKRDINKRETKHSPELGNNSKKPLLTNFHFYTKLPRERTHSLRPSVTWIMGSHAQGENPPHHSEPFMS